eukprot:6197573-Pleurochrysis_carterae.AAC.2
MLPLAITHEIFSCWQGQGSSAAGRESMSEASSAVAYCEGTQETMPHFGRQRFRTNTGSCLWLNGAKQDTYSSACVVPFWGVAALLLT